MLAAQGVERCGNVDPAPDAAQPALPGPAREGFRSRCAVEAQHAHGIVNLDHIYRPCHKADELLAALWDGRDNIQRLQFHKIMNFYSHSTLFSRPEPIAFICANSS